MQTCFIKDCNKPKAKSHKVCSMHKARKERHGDYETVHKPQSLIERKLLHRFNMMKQRCYNPQNQAFKNYGGRGIKICERWLNNPALFIQDMGEPLAQNYTLDRINNDGDYELSNCRWVLRDVQTHNQRPQGKIPIKGVSLFRGKYRVTIARGKIKTYIGAYNTLDEAKLAYLKVEKELYYDIA